MSVKPTFLFTVLFPVVFGLMASFFLVIGLRGVITRKPFLISARWLLALALLGFSPAVLQAVSLPGSGAGTGALGAIRWISPAVLIILVIFLALSLRGFMAFGVTDESFRNGLLHSLKQLNLPYEETLSAVRLPTVGADLQVSVQTWIGTGQLKMKQRSSDSVLRDVVNGMNEYYQNGAVSNTNMTCCIFYVVMGGFLALLGGIFLFGFDKIL
jgi:hypothetical protein